MSTEISMYQAVGSDAGATLRFIDVMGEAFHTGGLAGCKSVGQGKAMALTCLCERITPLQFMRTYHLMDGKPSMRSDAMLAAFMGAGGRWKWIEQGDDGKKASAHVVFGDNDLEVAFTIEDAKRAGLVKDKSNWEKDPGAMLRARCVSKAVRMVAPHIVAGIYTPEEMGDIIASDPMPSAPPAKPRASSKQATSAAPAQSAVPAPPPPPAPPAPAAPVGPSASQTEQLVAEAGDGGAIEFIGPDLRSEIQDIQTRYTLMPWANNRMVEWNVDHINKLTLQQGRRLLVDLYVKGLGFEEKLKAVLASKGLQSLDEADEALIQQMLDSLRGKHNEAAAGN